MRRLADLRWPQPGTRETVHIGLDGHPAPRRIDAGLPLEILLDLLFEGELVHAAPPGVLRS